jgi:hypothetical protein
MGAFTLHSEDSICGEGARGVGGKKLIVYAVAAVVAIAGFVGAATPDSSRPVAIVVHERGTSPRAAERLVQRLGGHVGRGLPLVHGFTATIPEAQRSGATLRST